MIEITGFRSMTSETEYKFFESDKIHCKALVISDYSSRYSHWNSQKSLGGWLKEQQIPGLFGIDTRALTQKLRDHGAMLGKILFDNEDIPYYDPNKDNIVARGFHEKDHGIRKREI